MMNARIKNFSIAIGLILLLTFLYVETTDINAEEHNQYMRDLRQLKELHATLDKHVLESRYGLLTTYDVVNHDLQQILRLQKELAQVPVSFGPAEKTEIQTLLNEQAQLLQRKASALEQFKSQNAIINNSLHYFPVAVSKLLASTTHPALRPAEKEAVTHLLQEVLVYYLLTDPNSEPKIQQLRASLLTAAAQTESQNFKTTLSHAQTILTLKPEIDRTLQEMISYRSAALVEKTIAQYESYYQQTLSRTNFFRAVLFIFSVLLLFYIGYIIVKLKQTSTALQAANETLDQKVQERTAKLRDINAELQRSEANNNALIYAIPDSLWRMNHSGLFLDFIPPKGDAVFPMDWEGKTVFEMLPFAVAEKTMHYIRLALEKEQMQLFDFQLHQNDRTYHYESRLLVCGTAEILAIVRDISEQKFLEEQLQRAQKLESIGQLAAGIAHEINTPTQYVGDNTRFLKDGFQDLQAVVTKNGQLLQACRSNTISPELLNEVEEAVDQADLEYLTEEIPKAIEQALLGVERISKIVQSMKEFAHPGSDDKQATDLNRAIESTITIARNQWKYVADLATDFDPQLPLVPCFVGEFNQVILNLIINAAHAIGDTVEAGQQKKGRITVHTRQRGEWAEIRIGDTGTGIPEAVRSKIFDPFFTTKQVGQGTGQGLAISHQVIVEKHQGQLSFETEVGKGTTFIIRLPLAC